MLLKTSRQGMLHFYPGQIAWIGFSLLSLLGLWIGFLIWKMQPLEPLEIAPRPIAQAEKKEISFSLPLCTSIPEFSMPQLQGKMTFSFDPPRPDGGQIAPRLLVRLKETGESRRVMLPSRLDLEFKEHRLCFASGKSLLWIELSALPQGQIVSQGWVETAEGARIDAGRFQIAAQECPIQGAQEFAEESAFRALAEAQWWGRDVFRPHESGERLELGELLELKEGDWLIWRGEKWEKTTQLEKDLPIAKIQSITSKMLILEGWDREGHTRIGLSPAPPPPFKMRTEDLISALRVRSEKQISCMLEKQCIVLKVGDWVFKTGNRWKVLRKKEERDAFLSGKLLGELFILDQISQKQGQKMIQGRLFNPGRTQVIPIEMMARSRKSGKTP